LAHPDPHGLMLNAKPVNEIIKIADSDRIPLPKEGRL
jgi:hypothetical protein